MRVDKCMSLRGDSEVSFDSHVPFRTDDRIAGKGEDDKPGYNVVAGAVLHLVLALRGGR
jgi:hypothetical protein